MLALSLGMLLSLAPWTGVAEGVGSSPPSSTSSAPIATHGVSVGEGDQFAFAPNTINANVGDIVEFRFYPQNHSVARADYKFPCVPSEDEQGFWSGFQNVGAVLNSQPPTFQIVINDTNPIFFYCATPGACQSHQMIGVINPNATETLEVQLEYAKNTTEELYPGQPTPSEGATSTSSPTPSSTSSLSSSSTPTATASIATPTTTPSSKPVLPPPAIAGIAVGGSAVIILAAALFYLCGRQRTLGEALHMTQKLPEPLSYIPRHGSTLSSATYPPKFPQMEIKPLSARRYSGQGRMYDRAATETESFRSGSPRMDENRESMMPNFAPSMYSNESPVSSSPARLGSPSMIRAVPDSPVRHHEVSPISPLEDTMSYQPFPYPIPPALRVQKYGSEHGPHELPVDNPHSYIPYRPRESGKSPAYEIRPSPI